MTASERLLIEMEPHEIIYLDKIFESMENLAIFTVIDGKKGLVSLLFPPDLKNEVLDLLKWSAYDKKIINS